MASIPDILKILQTLRQDCYEDVKNHLITCDKLIYSLRERKETPTQNLETNVKKKDRTIDVPSTVSKGVKFKVGRSVSLPIQRKILNKTKIKFLNSRFDQFSATKSSSPDAAPQTFNKDSRQTKSCSNALTLKGCEISKSELLNAQTQLSLQCMKVLNSSAKDKILNVVVHSNNCSERENFTEQILNSCGVKAKIFNDHSLNGSKFPDLKLTKIHVKSSESSSNGDVCSDSINSGPRLINATFEIMHAKSDDIALRVSTGSAVSHENANDNQMEIDKTPVKKITNDLNNIGAESNQYMVCDTPVMPKSSMSVLSKPSGIVLSKPAFLNVKTISCSPSVKSSKYLESRNEVNLASSSKNLERCKENIKNNSQIKKIVSSTKIEKSKQEVKDGHNPRCLRPRPVKVNEEKPERKRTTKRTRTKDTCEIPTKQKHKEETIQLQKIKQQLKAEEKKQQREQRMQKTKQAREKIEKEKREKQENKDIQNVLKAQENKPISKTKRNNQVTLATKAKVPQKKNTGAIPRMSKKSPQLETVSEVDSDAPSAKNLQKNKNVITDNKSYKINETVVLKPADSTFTLTKNSPNIVIGNNSKNNGHSNGSTPTQQVHNGTFVKTSPAVIAMQNSDGVFKKPTGTPVSNSKDSSQKYSEDNYEMTPYRGDSDEDDEEDYSKPIPSWASGLRFKDAIIKQAYNAPDIEKLFGPIPKVELEDIFGKNARKKKRTSSAIWKNFSFTLDI